VLAALGASSQAMAGSSQSQFKWWRPSTTLYAAHRCLLPFCSREARVAIDRYPNRESR
jgi:hypothetical protein